MTLRIVPAALEISVCNPFVEREFNFVQFGLGVSQWEECSIEMRSDMLNIEREICRGVIEHQLKRLKKLEELSDGLSLKIEQSS